MKRFEKVKNILEVAVEGTDINAHGNFWRATTLDEFKVKEVFGEQLLIVGNAEESNLIKALEGREPFGVDTGNPNAFYERMPIGFAPVSLENITFLRQWIDAGCPDDEVAGEVPSENRGNQKIIELMQIPPENHDLGWLLKALQSAIELELSTLPPYLCAMWSIEETAANAAYPLQSLKQIVIEEMQHLGAACNLLTTLGGTPILNQIRAIPQFPGPLPGGVKPELKNISLKKLSVEQLKVFMEIELPEFPPILPVAEAVIEEFPTIGEFYDVILAALQNLAAEKFTGNHQVTALGLHPIRNSDEAKEAIAVIKQQGEGTELSPEDQPGQTAVDLAHYYRFRELVTGRQFIKDAAGQWVEGAAIPFPGTLPMADIPKGGYPESKEFDRIYTNLLDALQKAWETGSNVELINSLGIMKSMKTAAKKLMQTPIDANDLSKGTFGPSFLLIRN